MRLLLDPKNEELTDILKTLLTDNIDITAREVARRHSTLKNPSAFTRNEARSALIAAAQGQQRGVRNIVAGSGASGSLQDQVAGYRQEIKRLEDQLTHMVAAHAGLTVARYKAPKAWIVVDEDVGAELHGVLPLRRRPRGDAGHAVPVRLLLQAARVGDEHARLRIRSGAGCHAHRVHRERFLAGVDHYGAGVDQCELRRILVQTGRALLDVLDGF